MEAKLDINVPTCRWDGDGAFLDGDVPDDGV
jgi:hypothetical protein